MKQIDIEKYIKDHEVRRITITEIAEKEKVSHTTIRNRIDEYYNKTGKEKPDSEEIRKRQIEIIKKYIKDYEDKKISAQEIADKENLGYKTVLKRIHEYYEENGIERPEFRGLRRKQVDIEKYMKDYEDSKMTINDIAREENVKYKTISIRMQEYYSKQTMEDTSDKECLNSSKFKIRRQISKSIRTTIKDFLRRGLTREEIRESAKKRQVFISDELFEELEKGIQEEKNREER